MSDSIGYYSYLSGRTARFLAHQKRRGMSAAALDRLPKLPDLPEPIILQARLATQRDAINYANQAAQKNAPKPPRNKRGHFERVPRPPRAYRLNWSRTIDQPETKARIAAIVKICADAYNVCPADILCDAKNHWQARPRSVTIYLMRVVLRLGFPAIGAALERDHTTCFHAFRRCRWLRKNDVGFRQHYTAALLELRRQRLAK